MKSAKGVPLPLWPLPGLPAARNAMRAFMAPRDEDDPPRIHPGVDIPATLGTVVRAMEPGVVVNLHGWDGPETQASVVQCDSGLVLIYGALLPGKSAPIGARLSEGAAVGVVGRYPKGSSMLHVETWEHGTREHASWEKGKPAPAGLLAPDDYMARAGEVVADGITGGIRWRVEFRPWTKTYIGFVLYQSQWSILDASISGTAKQAAAEIKRFVSWANGASGESHAEIESSAPSGLGLLVLAAAVAALAMGVGK